MNPLTSLRHYLAGAIALPGLLLFATMSQLVTAQTATNVFINEIHYDNSSADTNESIEIAGPAGTDLTGWSLVLYNGTGGAVYGTLSLSGIIPNASNGFGFVNVPGPSTGIQNGAPDGIALVDSTNTVRQFLSYEGTFTAVGGPANGLVSTDIGVNEDGTQPDSLTLQLQGSGSASSDFVWAANVSATRGTINIGQTFSGGSPSPTPTGTPTPTPTDTGTPTPTPTSTSTPTPTPTPTTPPVPVPTTTIPKVQGAGHQSPMVGTQVVVDGIVIARDSNGYYLQDPVGDGNIQTSDAILVFTGSAPTVTVGDYVIVRGNVTEFQPGGASTNNLTTTELTTPTSFVISSGNALPAPVILGNGGRVPPASVIDNDNFTTFDPNQDGIDFYESLEAMRVTVQDALAVSSTNSFGEIFTVVDNGIRQTNNGPVPTSGLSARGTMNISSTDFNPERIQIDDDNGILPGFTTPQVTVGARLGNVTGVVSYNFGNFEVLPTEAYTPTPSTLTPETTTLTTLAKRLNIATFNVENLDPSDVAVNRFDAIATIITNNLNRPDIIALQEIQDNDGATNSGVTSASLTLQTLQNAIIAQGGPGYLALDNTFIGNNTNGGEPSGNIRTVFLYNPARVQYVANSLRTITNPVDQQTNPNNPFFGSRLPLVADFQFLGRTVTVINNHLTSKGGSAPLYGQLQSSVLRQEDPLVNGGVDQRRAQSLAILSYVQQLQQASANSFTPANIVVLGDFNEFEFLSPLTNLAANLVNLTNSVPARERYTFLFEGNSQSIDHVLVSPSLSPNARIDIVHVNSEFADTPNRASDHDPTLVQLNFANLPQ